MVEGFAYVQDDEPGPMAGARVGERVRMPSWDPPWILVHHELNDVMVTRWPGRLLRVRSVPPSDDEERAALAGAAAGLLSTASYTRVFAVDVLAELRPGMLFGTRGDAVVEVLECARLLSEPVASELAAARHPNADMAYSRAWERWLSEQPNGASYRNRGHHVLAAPSAGPVRSPIGYGFSLVARCVEDSARRVAGAAAFTVVPAVADPVMEEDEEDQEGLLDPWCTARSALLDAAMALGAPELVDSADAALLTAPWRARLEG